MVKIHDLTVDEIRMLERHRAVQASASRPVETNTLQYPVRQAIIGLVRVAQVIEPKEAWPGVLMSALVAHGVTK
jgi:hypothetical protein